MSNGILIPDHFVDVKPSTNDMNIASIAWGFSLGVCIFTGAKGTRQTVKSWKRGRRTTTYLTLLWMEWASSTIMSAVTWCHLRRYIPPGFPIFFVVGTCIFQQLEHDGRSNMSQQSSSGLFRFRLLCRLSSTEFRF